jgi:hypothetical protein
MYLFGSGKNTALISKDDIVWFSMDHNSLGAVEASSRLRHEYILYSPVPLTGSRHDIVRGTA